MPRTVLQAPDFRRAIEAMKYHAEPVENPWPLHEPPLIYRVLKEDGQYLVRGYTTAELRELSRGS